MFFYSGIATFTLTCKAKGGNAGTQLIPEEASLKCKSNSEAENKVSYYCFSISQEQHLAKWLLSRAECTWDIPFIFFLLHYQILLEIVGEWVMNRQPFWIKIFHISPILLGRFSDKKEWNLLSVLCSLWGIFGKENLQCVFSLQTLQCAMFWFSLKLA